MQGLTYEEVKNSRDKYGKNTIENHKSNSFIKTYISSLNDPIIRILLIALGIKVIFLIKNFDWYETIGIVIAIFIASFISTISEYSSEKSFEKLQEESSKIKVKVKRENKLEEIFIEDIVVGDIVVLQSGDRIPADGKIIKGSIYVDESSINGESKEKYKTVNDVIYKGCVVYNLECIMEVEKIGLDTLYGHIALELTNNPPISPLKNRLTKLAGVISKIGYICAILTSFSYLFSVIVLSNNFDISLIRDTLSNTRELIGNILYALTLAVTVIIVAVPEGLPMMITLVLSSNMKKMIKDNVLVRKLVGIETSGSMNILFTDKTGTLTTGNIEVIDIIDGNNNSYSKKDLKGIYSDYIKLSFLNNNSSIIEDNNVIGGNSTDKALIKYFNINKDNYRVIDTVPFDSKRKYSKTVIDYKGKKMELIKGAPEVIIKDITYYYDSIGNKKLISKSKIMNKVTDLASHSNRVIACSIDNTFLCLVVLKDEIKKETYEAVRMIKNANIQMVMITGDEVKTACSIGREINLINGSDLVLTSSDINKMSDIELKEKLSKIKIIARALPSDKSRLVKIAQSNNLIVGMTGDGVNDAPALKLADVGFSMGSGAEVAKEASDIVILDNNLLSIAKSILYGRTIFKSIRKFLIFQLSVNMCALTLSIIGPFINVNTPVTVIQMLWINMVMDTLAGLAFSYEPPLLEYMTELPKKSDEHIINKYMINEILFTGTYCSLLMIIFLKLPLFQNMFRDDIYFKTAFFGLFIFISIFNSFNARTNRINIFANILKNKVFLFIIAMIAIIQMILIYYGGNVFRTSGLSSKELLLMLILALTVIPIDLIRKIILRLNGVKGRV